ncbi:hypothetical protein glysoja_044352 [Glycine soja]|uniref:Uncharacterized protein n=1 Tax=Glycine soja TaxID=3848 RepID=A0A0B2Q1V8_GLYSO|nr:hypothetical protein glysoja_044352 [Glycine soja]
MPNGSLDTHLFGEKKTLAWDVSAYKEAYPNRVQGSIRGSFGPSLSS